MNEDTVPDMLIAAGDGITAGTPFAGAGSQVCDFVSIQVGYIERPTAFCIQHRQPLNYAIAAGPLRIIACPCEVTAALAFVGRLVGQVATLAAAAEATVAAEEAN